MSQSGVSRDEELSSNQEEADTKVILHCRHAAQNTGGVLIHHREIRIS